MNTTMKGMGLVDQSSGQPSEARRLRVWEVEAFFKCQLVGTCLSKPDQRRILRRSGVDVNGLSAFEVHELLVASTDKKCPVAERIDTRLAGKFAKTLNPLFDLSVTEFKKRWRAAFAQGTWENIFWAVVSRPDLSYSFRREVFGCVHMSMHWSCSQSACLKKKLADQEKRVRGMNEKSSSQTAELRKLKEENDVLRKQNAHARESIAYYRSEQERLHAALAQAEEASHGRGHDEWEALEEQVTTLTLALEEERAKNEALVVENGEFLDELNTQLELNEQFQQDAREIMEQLARLEHCDATCPSFDLCKKRILLVGGVTRIKNLYRQLIEEGGGVFEYHDGYMTKGAKDLERRLKQADVVLCPVTCNSHGACSMVKKLGKKYNKPVHMMGSSSLTALSQVIRGEGHEDVILN
ncbi:MAG: hypothetical protein CSA21_05685 [Deltaproteobacteria bacterium]|nr:MAG: hypothetical protein CSA21_05685 [Deltaproteobacteria bacterium]